MHGTCAEEGYYIKVLEIFSEVRDVFLNDVMAVMVI